MLLGEHAGVDDICSAASSYISSRNEMHENAFPNPLDGCFPFAFSVFFISTAPADVSGGAVL